MEEIIIQWEPEKQDKNQILEKIFFNVSDSELKLLCVRFWIKFFTTCPILNEKFHDASDFEEKYFFKSTILKKKLILKTTILKKKLILKRTNLNKKYF